MEKISKNTNATKENDKTRKSQKTQHFVNVDGIMYDHPVSDYELKFV